MLSWLFGRGGGGLLAECWEERGTALADRAVQPPPPPHREDVAGVVRLERPREELARGDHVRRVEPQPREAAREDEAVDAVKEAPQLGVRRVEADRRDAAAGRLDPLDVRRADVRPLGGGWVG